MTYLLLEGFFKTLFALLPTTISLLVSDNSVLDVSFQIDFIAELFSTYLTNGLLDRQGYMYFLHVLVKLNIAAKLLGACTTFGWVLVLSPIVEVQVPLSLVFLIAATVFSNDNCSFSPPSLPLTSSTQQTPSSRSGWMQVLNSEPIKLG